MEKTIGSGMIQTAQAANAAKSKKPSPSELMRKAVNSVSVQEILKGSLKENAGAFTASMIELYSSDDYLQKCEAGAVMREALKAVSLHLPINKQLGFAYIIPRRDHGVWKPQFQIGYKGYLQLAMRTGAYRYINAGEVYEGELVAADKLTGMVDLSGTASSDTVIGYFAYIETINGYKKTLYWSKEKVIRHCERYSDSYKHGNAIWTNNFSEMAIKTVLRYLLSHWGVMTVEMINAFSADGEAVQEIADDVVQNGAAGEPFAASVPSAAGAQAGVEDAAIDAEYREVEDADE